MSVLCQRYTRYTGEITWKTTSKTTESTSQNNRLFLKTNPLLLLQKQKQELLQRQQRKLSRKKIFLLVRRTSRPEREAFFLGQDDSCQETDGCTGGFCVTLGTPPQLRIRSTAPPEVEPRALRAGLHHSSNHTVDVQTPPASLHSATSNSALSICTPLRRLQLLNLSGTPRALRAGQLPSFANFFVNFNVTCRHNG